MYSMVTLAVLRTDDWSWAPLNDDPEKASAGEAAKRAATARTDVKNFMVLCGGWSRLLNVVSFAGALHSH
jgi:hypothetical protein